MKRIDFEAHFLTEEFVDLLRNNKGFPRYMEDRQANRHQLCYSDNVTLQVGGKIGERLFDLGEGRIKEMDAVGVDVQVTLRIMYAYPPTSAAAALTTVGALPWILPVVCMWAVARFPQIFQ